MDKYSITLSMIRARNSVKSIVDVGCRDCVLKKQMSSEDTRVKYTGVDLYQNSEGTVDIVCDVEKGIPVADEEFDVAVALDILEHLNDVEGGLRELDRISSKYIFINLPNLAHLFYRLLFLVTGRLGSKYDLSYDQDQDRHRWVTILEQADRYMKRYCQENNYSLDIIWLNSKEANATQRDRIPTFEKILEFIKAKPSLHVRSMFYIIEK